MLQELISFDWEIPPEGMGFELNFSELLQKIQHSLSVCLGYEKGDIMNHANRLYIQTPGIVSTTLNNKIKISQNMGINTELFSYDNINLVPLVEAEANSWFIKSIDLSKKIFLLDRDSLDLIDRFRKETELIRDTLYESTTDKYTWRASNPRYIHSLAENINDDVDLIVGSAHGSIRPALLLSNLINSELYFIRMSRFKIQDIYPHIFTSDIAFLRTFEHKKVIVFDEDLASGKTLKIMTEHISETINNFSTAAVISHYLSSTKPDYLGYYWYDQ